MPILDGYLVVANDVPTFVIPVLIDRPGGNHSLIQKIDPDNRVSSFFEVEVGNNYEITTFKFECNVGDQAIWGFRQSWSRLSEQNLRIDKWSVCRG